MFICIHEQMGTSYIYACKVEIGNENPIYKCVQMDKTYSTFIIHKIFKLIWSKSHYSNTGIKNLTIFTEIWCSHGCTTERLVDACEQDIQIDTKADRLAEEPG